MDSVSVDDLYSGASISLAPPRQNRAALDFFEPSPSGTTWTTTNGSWIMNSHKPRVHSVRGDAGPPSEQAAFYDAAEETPSVPHIFSGNSIPTSPRIVEPLRGLHDENGATRIPWLPPQEGFHSPQASPKGSPRHGLPFSDSGTEHPLLNQYISPPTTHPILQHSSPTGSHPSFGVFDSRNDLEGA